MDQKLRIKTARRRKSEVWMHRPSMGDREFKMEMGRPQHTNSFLKLSSQPRATKVEAQSDSHSCQSMPLKTTLTQIEGGSGSLKLWAMKRTRGSRETLAVAKRARIRRVQAPTRAYSIRARKTRSKGITQLKIWGTSTKQRRNWEASFSRWSSTTFQFTKTQKAISK